MRFSSQVGVLLVALVALGCAGGGARQGGALAIPERASASPKRITAAIMTDPTTVFLQMDVGTLPGTDTMQALVHAGLSVVDDRGGHRPQLAEQLPTLENGLWKLFPDGRMETTWHIRSGAVWHDGAPVVAEDMLFTAQVGQDRDLPRFADIDFKSVESIEAIDARTISVRWKEPFIDADRMFAAEFAYPLPRHLLESTYRENKAAFMDLPYWSTEYVGAGPFRLREWERGSHILLEAFDQYPLGRPKIDSIEVKLVPYGNTLVAGVLAGAVDLTLGRSISVEQAAQLTEQWRDGRVGLTPQGLVRIWPQFLNPNPPVILDARFRRALLQAIDRDEMADTLQRGVSPAAHSFLYPGQPQYRELEDRYLVRYAYDPRQAAEGLAGLGYRRGPDGMLRDGTGQPLAIRYFVTIPQRERMEILGRLIHHISDQLPILPLYYGAEPAVIAHRLRGVGARPAGSAGQTQAWNAHEWDVVEEVR